MASSETEQFSGKVVIVTGSTSGFGEAIALNFAKYGAKVTICGRNVNRLQQVKDKCTTVSGGHPERFLAVSGDLLDPAIRNQVVNGTIAEFGQLDILVCNAGVFDMKGTLLDATEETFNYLFDNNTKTVFFMIQAALPHLEKSKGNIVSMGSIASTLPWSPMVLYSMTKAAIEHMTNCLALELAPKGIRVNTVNPGYGITRVLRPADDDEKTMEVAETVAKIERKKQPLENRLVTLEEAAEAVAFIASDKASFITGQHLYVEGGRMLTGPLCYEKVN